jgi:polyketide cyclase/dehydrase/lipid transport protein
MSEATEAPKEAAEQVKEKATGDGDGGGVSGTLGKLVVPAAAAAGTLLSGYAAKKVPELLRDHVQPRLEQAGHDGAESVGKGAVSGAKDALAEHGGIAGKAASKLLGGSEDGEDGKGGEKAPPRGWGRGRRLPVQVSVDVAVPVKVAYNEWTQFEFFPKYMHRVEQIEQRDDKTVVWHENIWHIRRSWKSEIVEQVPNQRIVWRSDSRGGLTGVVTFHALSDRLTRIELNVDFQPQGLFEKLASGLRFHRRALKTDLVRFKAFVEMRNEETGKWRGKIEDEDEKNPAKAELDEDGEQSRSEDDGDDGDGDPERSREERQKRRRQRQKTLSSSR